MIALPAAVSATAVFLAGALAVLALQFGPASTHMAQHIALMNLLAPLTAVIVARRLPTRLAQPSSLWVATSAQLVLLWAVHAPGVQQAAANSGMLSVVLLGLFLVAVGFWVTLIGVAARAPWQAIFALLVTGKVACLLGALLIFAPRVVYAGSHHGAATDLADQQLAGLLMVTACPLSYLIAGVVLAAQMMAGLDRRSATAPRPGSTRHRLA